MKSYLFGDVMYVATYSQIHRAVTLGTCCSTWPAVLYFLYRQTRDSHVIQFYDQNFSGDASRCTKALRGSHENRTQRPKLKTEGCTNLRRQVIVKTKNLFLRGVLKPNLWDFQYGNCFIRVFWGPRNNSLFLKGVVPKIYEFSVRELLHASVWGAQK